MEYPPQTLYSTNTGSNHGNEGGDASTIIPSTTTPAVDVNNVPFLTPREIETRIAEYNTEFSTR